MKPSTFEFANALTFAEATDLLEAVDGALAAMAHFGSDEEHMQTLSALRILAMQERARVLRNKNG